MRQLRILIACNSLILSGGIMRFERTGVVLQNWGHKIAYVCFSDLEPDISTTFPILTIDQALLETWDAVMIPGAGFPDEIIDKFYILRRENFGVRVQHILNDQSRRTNFMKVNQSLKPHIVIFNNQHWPVGSFTDFSGDRFHILMGGVDLSVFYPLPYKNLPLKKDHWIIGGQAHKNPEPLIEALHSLPQLVSLRLFGNRPHSLSAEHQSLIQSGRLEFIGPLLGNQSLAEFYNSIDCIVMTETFAGWANIAAEAMACGVPVVCTPHGTLAFAHNEETALVIDMPTPSVISDAVRTLINDFSLCKRLASQARIKISAFTWDNYAQQLVKLIQHDGVKHYTYSPEDGLYGKWPFEERLLGLTSMIGLAKGCSIIDFGAAEGLIAREFLVHGAIRVRGFELDADRVTKANSLCANWNNAKFYVADLSDWDLFYQDNKNLLEPSDIVLYLGIHHHLPSESRLQTLKNAARLATKYFAIRTPIALYKTDQIDQILCEQGLQLLILSSNSNEIPDNLGIARLYKRIR